MCPPNVSSWPSSAAKSFFVFSKCIRASAPSGLDSASLPAASDLSKCSNSSCKHSCCLRVSVGTCHLLGAPSSSPPRFPIRSSSSLIMFVLFSTATA
ncbi:hypothetical protein L596_028110 [Steinernema carpocapsae]|uniref:Uncharacterized protein n=1 Tax=Steinernema carpocapsae TaxID=34508 RepID=A0A4U5LXH0_STECR|nr:hypothetical protein L596_028110 [Steinernema carpocapsae]